MTRINLVSPKLLHSKHLVAEYRELPRIFGLVRDAIARGETPVSARVLSPKRYTLGAGHCRFFYTKLGFINERFLSLVQEMEMRGYEPQHRLVPAFALDIPSGWWGDYEPCSDEIEINVQRLNERMPRR